MIVLPRLLSYLSTQLATIHNFVEGCCKAYLLSKYLVYRTCALLVSELQLRVKNLEKTITLKYIVHRREGTGDMGIDPQPILVDEVYDKAALSSAMRESARVRWVCDSMWAMRHMIGSRVMRCDCSIERVCRVS
jgi:hypothetical protein